MSFGYQLFLYLLFILTEKQVWDIRTDFLEKDVTSSSSTNDTSLASNLDVIDIKENNPSVAATLNRTSLPAGEGAVITSPKPSLVPTSDTSIARQDPTKIPEEEEVSENGTEKSNKDNSSSSMTTTTTTKASSNGSRPFHFEYHGRSADFDNISVINTSSYEFPFPVFGSLQYRRVCSPIGSSSVVCMTIRFPWSDGVQLQDETVSFPQPVDERFYSLDKDDDGDVIIIDGDLLTQCKQLSKESTDDRVNDENNNDDDEKL